MTDSNGEVEFTTIFPGWYNGRICHIHFQVFVSSVYAAISQLSFPIAEKNALYADHSDLYTKGDDPETFSSDMIFSDGYALQLATLTPNTTTGGYDTYLEVTIAGSGVSALRDIEPETGGQFKLRLNFPNPFKDTTTITFTLVNAGNVKIELFDLNGKKVMTPMGFTKLSAGEHPVELNRNSNAAGLAAGSYAYQLTVDNANGVFRQSKLLTVE